LGPAAAEVIERDQEKERERERGKKSKNREMGCGEQGPEKEGGKLGYLKRKRDKMLWLISVHKQNIFCFL
jgi:hypothetical protein